jgi:chemotaxis protein histidine kinase CheA
MLSSIYVSEQLDRQLVNISQELAYKAVNYCAEKYNFDAEEVYRVLGLGLIKVERKKEVKSKAEKVVSSVSKPTFPLPYNGEMNNECCFALRQNNGLYTQCTGPRRGESNFCKGCASQMQKTGAEVPEYGTIEMRKAVGIFEYVDPKGRKPVAYTKVMKKYKLTEEQVLDEARKLNMVINPEHFAIPEETKRGRPKTVEKEPKEKGTRGRPKKSKKVVEIDGDTEDLFATLVANANEEVAEVVKSEDEEKLKKEKLAAEKAEKLAAEKAEKLAKKEAERLAREEKKKAEEEEKALKKAAAEQAKKEKELAAEKAKKEKEEAKKAKEATKSSKKVEKASPEEAGEKQDDEPDVVKKIEFEGKKYLKSKKTGIIYDYNEYTKNGDQVVVGKWNDASNKIDFNAAEEEEDEEEYDM